MARYLEGSNPQLRDKIEVHVLCNLNAANNVALKEELKILDEGRYDSSYRSYNNDKYESIF